jgi:ABC-type branched-subunit amino acid transport system ATPase component
MALLAVRDLSKRFDGLIANSDISLDIPEGSLFAVIGPNGAGTRSPRKDWCAPSSSSNSSRA